MLGVVVRILGFAGRSGGAVAGWRGGGVAVESERIDNFLLAVTGISLNRWG